MANLLNTVNLVVLLLFMVGNKLCACDLDSDFNNSFQGKNNATFELLPVPNYDENMFDLERIETLEQAELLLLRDDVQQFLDEFTDDIQRNIVEIQLRYCPHTPLCNFKFDDIHLDFEYLKSPCDTCLCENCNDTNSCCPDKTFVKKPHIQKNTECKTMSLQNRGNSYEVVTKCPSSLDSALKEPCYSEENMDSFSDIIPVTDMTTNITYVNKKCAICNKVEDDKIVDWQPQLLCVQQGAFPTMLKTENDLIHFVINSRHCDITYFMSNKKVEPTLCDEVISTCNVTGNWSVYDNVTSTACSSYENIFTVKSVSGKMKLFRNIFCALCNGEGPASVVIPIVSYRIAYSPSRHQVYAFSGLLKFNAHDDVEDKSNVDTDDRCNDGFIYDNLKETCLELVCSPLRMLTNNRCEPLFSQIRNIAYEVSLRLYPVEGWSKDFNDLSHLHDILFRAIDDKLNDHLSTLNMHLDIPEFDPYDYYVKIGGPICSMKTFHVKNVICSNAVCESFVEENFFEVELEFDVTDSHNIDDIAQLAKDLAVASLDIIVNASAYKFDIQVRDLGRLDYIPLQDVVSPTWCSAGSETVNLSKQKTCPLVSIPIDENDCFEYRDGVICSDINMTINVSEYHFDSNRSNLLVCSDVYQNYTAHYRHKSNNRISAPNASVVLSLICIIMSLLCLAMSFITFCLFPRLRTLPGKNNMSLIMSLIIAQTMFLISSFGQLESGSDGCKLVGVLTHFFWLVAIFWMNICTFHVFRVFTDIEALSVLSELKSFAMYIIYTSVLPICLVVVNIVVSVVRPEATDIGYGKITCYISSEKMVGYTFGIPVGFVIITNLIMFAFFIYKIKTAPSVSKDVKNERNDIIIFAKLSTLTGLTWVFGFIYLWTDIEVFSYLFIILNATQGVFLFLSFVCNRRVLSMYKNRSFGVTASSEAYRSRMTESTRQSCGRKA